MNVSRLFLACGLLVALATSTAARHTQSSTPARRAGATTAPHSVTITTYAEVKDLIGALADVRPPDLDLSTGDPEGVWNRWVARRMEDTRARLARGDEDSLANLLMFGTSFTRQPRMTPALTRSLPPGDGAPTGAAPSLAAIILGRVDDFVRALADSRGDERFDAMRALVRRKGLDWQSTTGREALVTWLIQNLKRVQTEYDRYTQELTAIASQTDDRVARAERSRLFRDRGIAPDTSLAINHAIDRTVETLAASGLLRAPVSRVAIVGPGLDFADKAEGYDFYPPQTLQPFAVADSLIRRKLARADALRMTTIDISERVNRHVARARDRGRAGRGYTIQLPIARDVAWTPELRTYWQQFAHGIGAEATAVSMPATVEPTAVRAVRIRPEIAGRLHPVDLDIVHARLDLAPREQVDLVVATNVFVYYDTFEQALALANVARMMKSGALLLSNNALPQVARSPLQFAGTRLVVYSDRPGDGDRVFWYQRAP